MCIFINLGWEIFSKERHESQESKWKYRYILLHENKDVKGKQLLHANEQQKKKPYWRLDDYKIADEYWKLLISTELAQFNIEKNSE